MILALSSYAGGFALGPKIGATIRSSFVSPLTSPHRSRWMLPTSAIGIELPGIVEAAPLHRQRELALGWLAHLELVADGDLGLAVAVDIGRGRADDPGRLLARRHDPLLPGRVLVPGAGASTQGDDVRLLVAVDVGNLDLVAAGQVGVDDHSLEVEALESGQWSVASGQ